MLRNPDLADTGSPAHRVFLHRFRVPHSMFLFLVEVTRDKGWLHCDETDAVGRPCAPLELKVLSVLRVLARGNTFDDIAELSDLSTPTVQRIFHTWCEGFSRDLHAEYIHLPRTPAEFIATLTDFMRLGLPGAVASMDATHIHWDKCPTKVMHYYRGKEKFTSTVHNVTVNHKGRIMSVSPCRPGAVNDKTLAREDFALMIIRTAPLYVNMPYNLHAEGGDIAARGLYVITDNGYHQVG